MYKAGIVSRKNHRNFGNILQLTALCEVVKDLGYAPVIADYTYHGWLQPFKMPSPLRGMLWRLRAKLRPSANRSMEELRNETRRAKFLRFYETRTPMSEPLTNAADLFAFSEACDALISGSDQVWAPMWYDPHYFLDFCPEDKKKISYAASFGTDRIPFPALEAKMARDIAAFAHISVREQSGAALVRRLTGREPAWTLDPTLLLEAAQYRQFEGSGCAPDRPYLLCYFLGGRPQNWRRARAIAKARGLTVAVIPYLTRDMSEGDIRFPEAGPEDFLELFHKAAFVCTDSFHGTAFSILYRIPFLAFERNARRSERMSTRITSLLELAGLQDRFVPGNALDEALPGTPIDFEEAHRRIAAARGQSLGFLRDALAQACSAPREAPWRVAGECCGCGACAAVCPREAITIRRDALGFRAAAVDAEKCVRCGKCRSVCPYASPRLTPVTDMKGLFAYKASAQTLARSSSGGFAHNLGEYLAEQGHAVIGCVYDAQNRRAVHRVAAPEDTALRAAFQGSKYIQSDLADAFAAIRGGMARGAFFGTPCQTAAVARMLGERRGDWVLVDLICHGIPSDALFEKYLDDLDRRCGTGKTPEVLFRDKRLGWRPSRMRVRGGSGSYGAPYPKDPFLRLYLLDFALRDSCHECPFRAASAADLRIGDYWGQRYKADNTGVSMVAALTDRGAELIAALSGLPGVSCSAHPARDYVEGQHAFTNPRVPAERGAVLQALNDPETSMAAIWRKWVVPRNRAQFLRGAAGRLKKALRRARRRT